MSYTRNKQKRQRSHHVMFQTALGMSIVRRDTAIINSQIKRGDIKPDPDVVREQHVICGCGSQGCVFVSVRRRGDEDIKDNKDPWAWRSWRKST